MRLTFFYKCNISILLKECDSKFLDIFEYKVALIKRLNHFYIFKCF